MFTGQRLRRLTAANLERRVPRRGIFQQPRPASGIKAKVHRQTCNQCLTFVFSVSAFAFMPDAGRVAPISACVQWQRDLYYTTKTLHAEYLTSYTNILQLIDYQYFTQCKMLPMSPTRNLHNPHTATRHKHGRTISRHRGVGKSVAPTDLSTSLWRITHRIRQNRLRSSGV